MLGQKSAKGIRGGQSGWNIESKVGGYEKGWRGRLGTDHAGPCRLSCPKEMGKP